MNTETTKTELTVEEGLSLYKVDGFGPSTGFQIAEDNEGCLTAIEAIKLAFAYGVSNNGAGQAEVTLFKETLQ